MSSTTTSTTPADAAARHDFVVIAQRRVTAEAEDHRYVVAGYPRRGAVIGTPAYTTVIDTAAGTIGGLHKIGSRHGALMAAAIAGPAITAAARDAVGAALEARQAAEVSR